MLLYRNCLHLFAKIVKNLPATQKGEAQRESIAGSRYGCGTGKDMKFRRLRKTSRTAKA
jgi:hypothetical protein